MKVVLERPVTWLESERDGDRNRLMYDTLLEALESIGSEVSEVDVHYGNDFMSRAAPNNGVLISYHSIGNSPNVWRLKEASIPFFYNLDRLGYSGWSELSVDRHKHEKIIASLDEMAAKNYCSNVAEWLVRENLSKYKQGNDSTVLPHDFIFFPMQVRSDRVATHNRLDPLDVLHEASKMSKDLKRPLLVKRHPYCDSKKTLAHLLYDSARNKYLRMTKASVTTLLRSCGAVVTGNSGVGLEAIFYGKPVYSFAKSEYDLVSFPIINKSDIRKIFKDNGSPHPNGYRFGHYYLNRRCFDCRDVDDIRRKLIDLVGIKRTIEH